MNEFGQKGEQHYLAVIGDLRRSREDPDRARTQLRLEKVLEAVNRRTDAETLGARFVITLGDEFQGLLAIPGDVVFIIDEIDRGLDGIPIRYGLGWGALATALRTEAIGMDGPCFHNARDALLRAKDEDRRIVVGGFGAGPDLTLNGILALMEGVRRRWKPVQEETVRLMDGKRLQKEVAAIRAVSTSVVSETLKSALYKQMDEAEFALCWLMNHFAGLPEAATRRQRP